MLRMPENRVAVVTGASSGIGQAIARELTAAGVHVYGASRSAPASTERGSRHVTMDVCDDASVRDGLASILRETGRIDVLVNNAGYLCAGAVEEISLAEAKAQFETNYFGVVRASLAVLPGMRERRLGHIITVSSLAGLVPVPFWGHYNASKFALEGLMETLRHEARPFGIQIALVEPGNIKTPFYGRPVAPGSMPTPRRVLARTAPWGSSSARRRALRSSPARWWRSPMTDTRSSGTRSPRRPSSSRC
jgi:NAD(P)-dependent dehydrogenase (short-subunit alcohol dehydrogenase family)